MQGSELRSDSRDFLTSVAFTADGRISVSLRKRIPPAPSSAAFRVLVPVRDS